MYKKKKKYQMPRSQNCNNKQHPTPRKMIKIAHKTKISITLKKNVGLEKLHFSHCYCNSLDFVNVICIK